MFVLLGISLRDLVSVLDRLIVPVSFNLEHSKNNFESVPVARESVPVTREIQLVKATKATIFGANFAPRRAGHSTLHDKSEELVFTTECPTRM